MRICLFDYTFLLVITFISTIKLPDGGAKLKLKLEQIEKALEATENTSNLARRVSDMSIADRPNTRKEALLHANNYPTESHKLLRAHSDMESKVKCKLYTSCFYLIWLLIG